MATGLEDKDLDTQTRKPEERELKKDLNQPEIDEKTARPTLRAISSAAQAWEIAKDLREQGQKRTERNATIADKYNGGAPFDQKKLKEIGQDWRNNASTNFLSSIVDRVKPQFSDALQRAKYLTNSVLPTLIQNAAQKSKTFRKWITKTIRAWAEWQDFIAFLSQEEVLIGYAAPVHLDPNNWRPQMFRNDEIFFASGTGQHAKRVQVFVVLEELLIHEFCDLIENQKAAKSNGYNVQNCIEVANREIDPTKKESELQVQDQIRENFFAQSFNTKQKTITLFHVLVREYSGGVDLWTVDEKEGKEIRNYNKLYDEMPEAVTLFTMQTGNRKFYGSKGLGRLLLNLHIAIERGRNLAMDQMYLSGLVILQVEEKDKNTVQPVVRHPFVILPKNVDIVKENIEFDSEGYLVMDQKLVEIAESIAGSFIPPQIQTSGTSNTKIEAAQKVEREERVKQGVLQRFNTQAADLIGTMQMKICSPLNMREGVRVHEDRQLKRKGMMMVVTKKVMDLLKRAFSSKAREIHAVEAYESKIADSEAVECIVGMLEEGLMIEEIAMLASSPTSDNLAQENQENDTNTLQFLAANQANPHIDAREATAVAGEIMMGEDRLDRVLIKDQDQTVEAEATRQQITEYHDMIDGETVPVSPRDNHQVHKTVLFPRIDPVMMVLSRGGVTPQLLQLGKNLLTHAVGHIELDPMVLLNPELAKQERQVVSTWEQVLAKAEKQLAEQQAAAGGAGAENLPIPVNGQPVTATGPGGAIEGESRPSDLEHLEAAGHVALRARELELKSEELQHKKGMDKAGLVIKTHELQQSALKTQADAQLRQNEAEITAEAVRQKAEADESARQDKQTELKKVE